VCAAFADFAALTTVLLCFRLNFSSFFCSLRKSVARPDVAALASFISKRLSISLPL
jgi:hypothetical protein